ncbi:unnamed protein product, partial [marine sediment metagenome]
DPETIHPKEGVESLRRLIVEKPPTTLSFQVGRSGYYGQWEIEEYIRELRKCPSFRR